MHTLIPHKGKTSAFLRFLIKLCMKCHPECGNWLKFGVVLFPSTSKEKWESELGPMTKQEGGELGSWRKGAIPHQQALSPPEVYECVCLCVCLGDEEEVCRGVVRGIAQPTVQLFKMFKRRKRKKRKKKCPTFTHVSTL